MTDHELTIEKTIKRVQTIHWHDGAGTGVGKPTGESPTKSVEVTHIECTCGETFDDTDEAHLHLHDHAIEEDSPRNDAATEQYRERVEV